MQDQNNNVLLIQNKLSVNTHIMHSMYRCFSKIITYLGSVKPYHNLIKGLLFSLFSDVGTMAHRDETT